MASPSNRRATKRGRSSISELAFHGIHTSRTAKAKSVTHVSGTKCHLCLGPLTVSMSRVRATKVEAMPRGDRLEDLERTRVVGAFPDGQSALNLAAARLRHIAGTAWSTKRYLNIELLKDQQMRGAITA
jgi:hypothetical protein